MTSEAATCAGREVREEPRWQQLARRAARQDDALEVRQRRELLCLTLDAEGFALPIERVREIVRLRPITPVPRAPAEILGVISLRGEIVQVVDLRRSLGLPPLEPDPRSRIVVLHGDGAGRRAGLLFDGASEVLRVPEEDFRAPPGGESPMVSALCVRGQRFVSVVDLDRMLNHDEHA